MRFALSNLFFLTLIAMNTTACVTNVVVQDHGPINMSKTDAKGNPLAPLVLQYKFDIPTDQYEIIFKDGNKKDYTINMNSNIDTSKGVVIYLPTNHSFLFYKFAYIKRSEHVRQDYLFSEDYNYFKLEPGVVSYLGYFEVSDNKADSHFRIHKANPKEREVHMKEAMKNLGFSLPVKEINY